MSNNLDRYKKDLEELITLGNDLQNAMLFEQYPDTVKKQVKEELKTKKEIDEFFAKLPQFRLVYQRWYSESKVLVKLLLPDRFEDFCRYYERPKTRKDILYSNYVIEDYLHRVTITQGYEKNVIVDPSAAVSKFQQQFHILASIKRRFETSLFDIKQLVQADLFDSELDAARELAKHKFYRAAGALAGVVLEKHLSQVCANHSLSPTRKNPTISIFLDILKNANVVDTVQWRFIQHLMDIRNKCDRANAEPTENEVTNLIDGIAKTIKTLF